MCASHERTTWWRLAAPCMVMLALVAPGVGSAASLAPMDSPVPETALEPACSRVQADAPAPQRDAPCWVQVQASRWLTRSAVHVAKGDRFRVRVPAGQFWFDADRRSLPLVGDPGSGLMNMFDSWKRVPSAPWFRLIGATAVGGGPDPAVRGATDLGKPDAVLVADDDGELVFFANDAVAPWGDGRYFYGNNHGRIWLQLQRCRTDAGDVSAVAPGAC